MPPDEYDKLSSVQRFEIMMSPQCDPLDWVVENNPEELNDCSLVPSQIAHLNYVDLPEPYKRAILSYEVPTPSNTSLEEAVKIVKSHFSQATSDERYELLKEITGPVCLRCLEDDCLGYCDSAYDI